KLLAAALLLGIFAQPAVGIMMLISVEELTRTSDSIVIGRVISIGTILSTEIPVRYVTIRVERYIKNDLGLATLEVSVLGGSINNMTVWVEDQPSFEVGERVLLFLSKRGGVFYVNGLYQGKYRLENGQAINQVMSRNTSERDLLLKIQSALAGVEKPGFLKDFYGGLGIFEPRIYVVATDGDPLRLNVTAEFWGFIANHTTSSASERDFISLLVSRGDFATGGYDIQLVSLQRLESDPSMTYMVVNFTDPGEGVAVTEAFTNPLILIPLGQFPPGEYLARMNINRFIMEYVHGVLVYTPVQTLLPEIWETSFTITEEPEGIEGTLNIQVTDHLGRNAGPAAIEIQGPSVPSNLITNDDGRLTIKLPAGRYEVRAHYRDLMGVATVEVGPLSEQLIIIRLVPVETPRSALNLLTLVAVLSVVGAAAAIIVVILLARHASLSRPHEREAQPPI
ncbi:MAG: protease complex subunit PrcB family protein, partial [Aigarchaeota archaeon]|nr:protease complex subunit PrcB family protein [Aigarchaeota archaeon]